MKVNWAPPDWQILPIGDAVNQVRKPVTVNPTSSYREIGIRSHGKGIFYKEEITGQALGDKRVFWVEPDCFVVNIVFAWEGAVAQTTKAESGMIASHRFPMYKPIAQILDLDFMTYFFKSKRGIHLLQLASPGGAGRNKTLGQQEFLNLEIPLPPLSEQRKIASILQTCDNTIYLTEQLIETKQKRKLALMQRLLTGKVRFPNFEGEWTSVIFEDVFSFLRTIAFSRADLTLKETEPTVFNMHYGDIHATYSTDILDLSKETKVPKISDCSKLPKGVDYLIDGDLVIADVSEDYDGLGACIEVKNVGDKKITGGLHTFVARDTSAKTAQGYRCYILKNPQVAKRLKEIATGISVFGISKTNLAKLQLQLPTLEEQLKIASIISTCDEELNLLKQKLAALRQQKKGLMQQLLTGKIRVKV